MHPKVDYPGLCDEKNFMFFTASSPLGSVADCQGRVRKMKFRQYQIEEIHNLMREDDISK